MKLVSRKFRSHHQLALLWNLSGPLSTFYRSHLPPPVYVILFLHSRRSWMQINYVDLLVWGAASTRRGHQDELCWANFDHTDRTEDYFKWSRKSIFIICLLLFKASRSLWNGKIMEMCHKCNDSLIFILEKNDRTFIPVSWFKYQNRTEFRIAFSFNAKLIDTAQKSRSWALSERTKQKHQISMSMRGKGSEMAKMKIYWF